MFLCCLVFFITRTASQYNPGSASVSNTNNEFLQPFLDPLEGSGGSDDERLELDGLRNTIPGEPGTLQPVSQSDL